MTKINYIMDDIKGMAEDAGTELMNQEKTIKEADIEMQKGLDNAKAAVTKLESANASKTKDNKKAFTAFVILAVAVLISILYLTSGGSPTNSS